MEENGLPTRQQVAEVIGKMGQGAPGALAVGAQEFIGDSKAKEIIAWLLSNWPASKNAILRIQDNPQWNELTEYKANLLRTGMWERCRPDQILGLNKLCYRYPVSRSKLLKALEKLGYETSLADDGFKELIKKGENIPLISGWAKPMVIRSAAIDPESFWESVRKVWRDNVLATCEEALDYWLTVNIEKLFMLGPCWFSAETFGYFFGKSPVAGIICRNLVRSKNLPPGERIFVILFNRHERSVRITYEGCSDDLGHWPEDDSWFFMTNQ